MSEDVVTMYDAVDIFPRDFSESLVKLTYPEKNFKYWANDPDIKVFVLFTNEDDVVYYSKKELNDQTMFNISQIAKECKLLNKFNPKNINWAKIRKRYRMCPSDEMRRNADVRLGFKLKNTFLVKAFFTFGLRTVERGTAHVIQTTNVPLLFYLYPKKMCRKVCRADEKSFPYNDMHVYDMRVLKQNGVYRIPPGTRYVLFTTQKNFFGLDMVPENAEIPFEYEDPVGNPVRTTAAPRREGSQTPHIEDHHRYLLEDAMMMPPPPQPQSSSQEESEDFYEFFTTEPFKLPEPINSEQQTSLEQQPQPSLEQQPQPSLEQQPQPSLEQQHQPEMNNNSEQQQQQQITYLLIPNPPIFERNIVLASPDFVKNYQRLMLKKLDKPDVGVFNSDSYELDPLDLTNNKTNRETTNTNYHDDDLMDIEDLLSIPPPSDIDNQEINSIITDICYSSPFVNEK